MNFWESAQEVCQRCLELRLCTKFRVPKPCPVVDVEDIVDLSPVMPTYEVTACGNCIDAMRKCGHADVEVVEETTYLVGRLVIDPEDRAAFIRAEVEAMDWPEEIDA